MAQKFYQKASVQVAIISGLAAIIIASVTIFHQRSELSHENKRLLELTQQQSLEINRLETQLTPFRTIALEKYAGPEGEALKQLAERVTTIDEALTNAQKELEKTKAELLKKTSDRSLTEEQKQVLGSSLKGVYGQVIIQADFMDSEAQMFAAQIKDVLSKTDLEILENVKTTLLSLHAKGIIVLVNDIKNPPLHTLPILKGFQKIGFDARFSKTENAKFPENALIIWVCHK
jgi:uncharacterized small protein (DUF1192 family)